MSNGGEDRTHTHNPDPYERVDRDLPHPEIPVSVTLTFSDGSSASIKVEGRDPEKQIYGVVWGEAIQRLHDHHIPIRIDGERYTWLALASNSPAPSVCRWEDGQIVCTPC